MKNRRTLSVLVEDHPGVLNRVVSLLRRRSFNIDSITVGHSEQPGVSRMTIVVIGQDEEVEQAGKQLYKLMEVLKVVDVTSLNCVAHELALIKVAAKSQTRSEVLQIAQIYYAPYRGHRSRDPHRRLAEHAESIRYPRVGANRASGHDAGLGDGGSQGKRSSGARTGSSRKRHDAARELSRERCVGAFTSS